MIYGSNEVYSPVSAYGISTFAEGIISGGTGGDVTATQGVNFKWVYDPSTPEAIPSGFTGQGWFADKEGSPIWYSIQYCGMTLQGILDEFAGETRTNLNDVFQNWQKYVDAQGSPGNDVLQQFQQAVGYDCWSNLYT